MHSSVKKSFFFLLLILGVQTYGISQKIEIQHVEPHHWWLGMKSNQLQIMLHGTNISPCNVAIKETGLTIKKVNRTTNSNYLFLDVEISPNAVAGIYHINLTDGKRSKTINYELKSESSVAKGANGYGPEDVVYLIFPDRFANGNTANDSVKGYADKLNRKAPFGRHGGDLAGIEKHMDYLKDLGITTLWINPVLDNNQPNSSYHGYSITDFYKIDPRFGNLNDYKRLTNLCHNSGMKMVQDMVANHIGSGHWWMNDLPDTNWLHPAENPFRRSNFRIEVVCDPHIAESDKTTMLDGWFDNHMPDLNQRNPYLANYLIQNSLWWIAEVGIDGIRMDTYPYNDSKFMTRYCEDIQKEFPNFSIVGEIWVDSPAFAAYFVKGALNQDGYTAGLPTLTDFPTYFAITKGLQEKGSWDSGLQRIYQALSQDFLYKDPSHHLTFLDNHDISRFYTTQKENFKKYKQGIGMLLTIRGVPQLYYGSELLMTGDGGFHPDVRKDFPGGWPGDTLDLFNPKNHKGKVDSAFQFTRKLLKWRKNSLPVTKGKFIHYLPEDNIYVYFRVHSNRRVMVVVNGNESSKKLKTARFKENLVGCSMATDVLTDKKYDLQSESLELPESGILILDVQ